MVKSAQNTDFLGQDLPKLLHFDGTRFMYVRELKAMTRRQNG